MLPLKSKQYDRDQTMAAHPPPRVLSLNGKGVEDRPRAVGFSTRSNWPSQETPEPGKLISSVLSCILSRASLCRCGLLTEVSDQVVMEQEQLLNDLLLIDSVRETAVSRLSVSRFFGREFFCSETSGIWPGRDSARHHRQSGFT